MIAAEMELSKVDNKTKVEATLQEEAAIRQDNKDRELERLADAAEKVARVKALFPEVSTCNNNKRWSVVTHVVSAGGRAGAGGREGEAQRGDVQG